MQHTQSRKRKRRRLGRVGALRTIPALILLALGATLAWLARACLGLGLAWGGERAAQSWDAALAGFRDERQRTSAPGWERHLLRIGPSLLLAVGGALITLWTLLLVGGALAWLALHGYGFYLLLATVSIGALLGSSIALTRSRRSQRDRLN